MPALPAVVVVAILVSSGLGLGCQSRAAATDAPPVRAAADDGERGGDGERGDPPRPDTLAAPNPGAGTVRGVVWRREAGFLGRHERVTLDKLANGRVVRITKGTGGRSLAFKLYFQDGTKGYYKPEQSFSGTNWYAEVAAHYLDRALGLGRVPPVVSRRMPWARLAAVAGDDRRVPEVTVGEDGVVRGALVAWLDSAPLSPARTPPGWESWVRVEPYGPQRITPFQRPAEYSAALNRRRAGEPLPRYYDELPEPDTAERAAELSDMLVFDFLTLNIDRWGGENGNVLTLGQGGPLIFLDNAAGFAHGRHRTGLMDDRLKPCQRFRRRTIDALRALDVAALGEAMRRDPAGPILDDHLLEGLEVRRRAVLDHVARLRARHGDAAVLPW